MEQLKEQESLNKEIDEGLRNGVDYGTSHESGNRNVDKFRARYTYYSPEDHMKRINYADINFMNQRARPLFILEDEYTDGGLKLNDKDPQSAVSYQSLTDIHSHHFQVSKEPFIRKPIQQNIVSRQDQKRVFHQLRNATK